MKKFKQNRYFSTFEYEIVDDGIIQRKRGLTSSSEKHIPFENIGTKIRKEDSSKSVLIIGLLFIIFLTTMRILSSLGIINFGATAGEELHVIFIMSSLLLLHYFWHCIDITVIQGGIEDLFFYRRQPNEKQVDSFIKVVIETTKEYLKNKYSQPNYDISLEKNINGLKYLEDRGIITKNEMSTIREKFERNSDLFYTDTVGEIIENQ